MTKPSAWRAFLRPAAYRTFWNAPRVEKGRTAPKHRPCLMEDRGKPCRKSGTASAFPAGASPRRSITDRMSDKMASRSLRPEIATKRAGCRAAPVLPPASSASRHLQHALHFPSALKDRLPPCGVPCRQPYQSVCPTESASSSQEGPFPSFQSYSSAPEASTREKEKKKTLRPPSLPSIPPPPLQPYVMPYFKQPPDSDGDFRPDLKKVFSGMGRAREGKGQFLQKKPLPLSSFPRSTAPPQQKSGAVTCTRFYRKNKGTWMCYFFSPLCLRLWPCCMK